MDEPTIKISNGKSKNKATPIGLALALIAVVLLALLVCKWIWIEWSYSRIEKNARKVVTAETLQSWAANVLQRFPNDDWVKLSELGTNFPAGLRDLTPVVLGPRVLLQQPNDTGDRAKVRILWGSGGMGYSGFDIGPTNFERGSGHLWAPGVYFFRTP